MFPNVNPKSGAYPVKFDFVHSFLLNKCILVGHPVAALLMARERGKEKNGKGKCIPRSRAAVVCTAKTQSTLYRRRRRRRQCQRV